MATRRPRLSPPRLRAAASGVAGLGVRAPGPGRHAGLDALPRLSSVAGIGRPARATQGTALSIRQAGDREGEATRACAPDRAVP